MIVNLDGNAIVVLGERVTTVPVAASGFVTGLPQDNDSYRDTARRLGYGSNTSMLNVDHEITHSLLAHWLGLTGSPVMVRLANGDPSQSITGGLEEQAVMAIQQYARHLGVDMLEVLQKAGRRA